jgi:hypothetical protein
MPTHDNAPARVSDHFIKLIAEIAVEAALALMQQAMEATANGTDFTLDPERRFKVVGRLPFIRELQQLSEEQRHDLFVYGFRSNPHDAQADFERLLIEENGRLRKAFRDRWKVVAQGKSTPKVRAS